MNAPKLSAADEKRLRDVAAQFPEIREHADRLLEGPPPEPKPDTGFSIVDGCWCGPQPAEGNAVPHKRGGPDCRAAAGTGERS